MGGSELQGRMARSSLPLVPLPLPLLSQVTQLHLHFQCTAPLNPSFQPSMLSLIRLLYRVVTQPKKLQNQGLHVDGTWAHCCNPI